MAYLVKKFSEWSIVRSLVGLFNSAVADGASAVAWTFDSENSFVTPGALLLDLQNGTVSKATIDKDGSMALNGALSINGQLSTVELSADPPDPPEGQCVLWQSDGTGSGADGDIMIKITAGGGTKTASFIVFATL